MDQIKQLKDYCDEISLDDLRFVKVRQKIEKMHEQTNITIIDFIKQKEYDLSVRAKNVLKYASHLYTYMNELSVARLVKIRNCGLKSIKEIIHVYPNLENEIGSLSTIAVKGYFDKKSKQINLNKEALADNYAIEFAEWVRKETYYENLTKEFIYNRNVYKNEKVLLEIFKKEKGL